MTLPLGDYLGDGEKFTKWNSGNAEKCFLEVFHEPKYLAAATHTMLGSNFLKQFYAVFDQAVHYQEDYEHITVSLLPVNGDVDELIPCHTVDGEMCVRSVPQDYTTEEWKKYLKEEEEKQKKMAFQYATFSGIGIAALVCICCLICFLVKKRRDQMMEDKTFAQGPAAHALVNEDD